MPGRERGRGWGSDRGQFQRSRSGRYSGRDFERYRGVADYHYRQNHTATVWESAKEHDYDSRHYGAAFASNRRRNALHSLRHPPAPPIRSRTWSPPWMRQTERFNVHHDSSQNRLPVMYREERMRSSPRTSFTEEARAPQRRERSPTYTARHLNDTRDVDAVQEHRHPRSLSSRRSPPYRTRVEISDHQERADGRFPEHQSGESTDKKKEVSRRERRSYANEKCRR